MENNPYFNKLVGIPKGTPPEVETKIDQWVRDGVEIDGAEFIKRYEVKKTNEEVGLIAFAVLRRYYIMLG